MTFFNISVDLTNEEPKESEGSTAAYCLNLPGKTLFLSHLLSLKKFRKRGNKDGAIKAFFKLEEEGLGKVLEIPSLKASQRVRKLVCSERMHLYRMHILLPALFYLSFSNMSLKNVIYLHPKMKGLLFLRN